MKNQNKFEIYKLEMASIKTLKGGVEFGTSNTKGCSCETQRDRDDSRDRPEKINLLQTLYL